MASLPPQHVPLARHRRIFSAYRLLVTARALSGLAALALLALPVQAAGPGRGQTAAFERDYLTFIIDHHYSALRMTELAAGTDVQRDPAVDNPQEGTSPTPGTAATQARAGLEDLKSMARAANRMQREEIMKAQKFLRDWYGTAHTPTLRPGGQQLIQALEQAGTGGAFDQAFLRNFSNHHYSALAPSLDCQVKSDLAHDQLRQYCDGIVHNQNREINDMRELLCSNFSVCDFQPAAANRNGASGG
jgi:uncharacterized protein (DUF305 family)